MAVIALLDCYWVGHGPSYFKIIMKTLCELGYEVWAFCPEPQELNEFIQKNSFNSANYKVFALSAMRIDKEGNPKKENTLRPLSNWFSARSAVQAATIRHGKTPDLVFFSWLDTMMGGMMNNTLIDIVFPFRWSGLYIQVSYLRHSQIRTRIKVDWLNPHSPMKSKNCSVIATLDEGMIEKLKEVLNKHIIHFPDFTSEEMPDETNEVYRKIKELANGRRIISLLGVLHKGKGVLTLLDAAKQLPKDKFFFVLAGLAIDDIRKNIQDHMAENRNILPLIDHIRDDRDFNAVVKASDIVCAVYENFRNSSNIMTKAALFGKPIIVSEGFLLEERVKNFNTGIAIPEANAPALISAIEKISNGLQSKVETGYERYFNANSIAKMKENIQALVNIAIEKNT